MMIRAIALALLALCSVGAAQANEPAQDAIRHMLAATFDREDAKVVADPVVVDGNVAVASWTQGDKGGRALVRMKDGAWRVVMCGGDALASTEGLGGAGVAPEAASRLSTKLGEAERQADPKRRVLFSSYEGLMPMEGHKDH